MNIKNPYLLLLLIIALATTSILVIIKKATTRTDPDADLPNVEARLRMDRTDTTPIYPGR